MAAAGPTDQSTTDMPSSGPDTVVLPPHLDQGVRRETACVSLATALSVDPSYASRFRPLKHVPQITTAARGLLN